ncbi:MAG: response regulator [Dehalococcoidia bacterium]
MRILIVDDSTNSRLVLGGYLSAAGYEDLTLKASAAETFEYLGMNPGQEVRPDRADAILIDVMMPEISGIQACQRIKDAPSLKDIPIIMVTGHDEEKFLQDAFAAGAIDYITKPVNRVELEARISSALALKQETDLRKLAYQELENQLLQSQKMASIGRLVGGVAHDFNNVLTLMMGYSQLGLRELAAEHSLYEKLQQLLKASEHAASLTGQLLALSRRQSAEPKIINLNDLVADTCQMLGRLIGEDVELIVALSERTGLVKADPTQLEQVLMNLAINARDAMPVGGQLNIETGSVVVEDWHRNSQTEAPPGEYAMFALTDTGSGMSAEVQARIFEPFFTTKEEGKGTGLGLATCFSIVKENGGCLEVDSHPGQGSTFKVYFPKAQEEKMEAESPEDRREMPRGSETILVTEDESALRKLISSILQDQGYRVIQAKNGDEALQVARNVSEGTIDLLLTDVVMPRMNGTELAYQLKTVHPDLKVILTSGYTDQDLALPDLGAEAEFIQKPFTPAALADQVRAMLDSYTAAQ